MSYYSSRYDNYYGGFAPYVPVAVRRAKALKAAQKAAKNGQPLSPVSITGLKIAKTFWGKAWCEHLESYSDYENRLPRGRTYVRNGSVIDLQITRGRVTAQVAGSELYKISIDIKPLAPARWAAIKKRCAGGIDSLVDLLRGKLSDGVMRVITDRDAGIFPAAAEIDKDCSCPDSAGLCKHLAAVLYGVGARLDEKPELLFVLRGVDHLELIEEAAKSATQVASTGAGNSAAGTLTANDLADVFGIDIETSPSPTPPAPKTPPLSAPASLKKSSPKAPKRTKKTAAKKPKLKKAKKSVRAPK